MLYPSGMLVARPAADGSGGITYTKHYFAGTQRVSSKIGTTTNLGNFLEEWQQQEQSSPSYPAITTQAQMDNAKNAANKVYTAFGINYTTPDGNTSFVPIAAFTPPSGAGGLETDHYFFHPDHLGSSNYSTNFAGEVSQHSEYFAFGETFIEEHKNSHNSPYKFNGKELDEESGLYYYGARYYDPRISIWASVDPLVEKTMSAYGYCSNNPVNRIDPTGLTDYEVNGETRTIKDGHNDVTMNVSERQFNRLQRKFDKGGSGYERMMNRMSVQNGFKTSSLYYDKDASNGVGIRLTSHKKGGDSYGQWAETKDDSNMTSGSALIGYQGMVLNKAEILIKSGAKGQSFSNLRHVSKTLQLTKYAGRGLGALGTGLSVYEDYKTNNFGWGTATKIGIGALLFFASAPVALTYAILDVGWGLATGTTITDNVANYVNKKMK